MKKFVYIILFIILRACSNDPVYAQSSNIFLINDQLTISGSDTLSKDGIDTASKFVSLANLSTRFSLGFQVSIYSPADTLQLFIGTTAAFTTGMTSKILPGVPFNIAYNKIRSGLNIYLRGLSQTSTAKYYYYWIGGI